MNVLIVSPWYKPEVGGVVETITNLISGLQTRGAEVSILLNGDSLAVKPVGTDGRTAIYSCRLRSPQAPERKIRAFLAWLFFLVPTILALRRFVKEQHIEIVNVHFPMANHFYFVLLKYMDLISLVISVHGSDMRVLFSTHLLNRWLTTHLLRDADALVACSHDLLQFTLKAIGSNPHCTTEVVYGGVEEDWVKASDACDPDSSGKYILAVGSLRPIKGFDILIRAFSSLGANATEVKLHIVGDGPMKAELVDLAKSLAVCDKIVFEGAVSHGELRQKYSRAIVCVIPSRSEALSLVALEAQAMGRAVIASAVGGLPEVIEDGVNGILFPMGDEQALRAAMTQLIQDPPQRERMGQRGRQRVKENFTWTITCRRYHEIFSASNGAHHGRKRHE